MKRNRVTKLLIPLCLLLLVSGCGNIKNSVSPVTPNEQSGSTTTGRLDNSSYQALLVDGKYVEGDSSTMSASRLNSNFNLQNYENGLLTLSKSTFPINDYYFQEGQRLSSERLKELLGRKSDTNPNGLNPTDENSPIVFQQILEQDYYSQTDNKLEGISIGIALNSVYYSADNATEIPEEKIESEGKKIAESILSDIRSQEGMENVKILIGLFKQASRDDLAGGNYFASSVSTSGTSISNWKAVNEKYVALPVIKDEKNLATETGLDTKFNDFKTNVQSFFPSLNGITGTALFQNDTLEKLSVTIETKYFGRAEIINFTQFVGTSAKTYLDSPVQLEIQINSTEGSEAFIERTTKGGEIYSHVFD